MSIIILIILVITLYVVVTYNSLVKMRNHVKEGWADIDVQLKRRYNLIPNIVETVKGYAAHEEAVFTKVTEARSGAINAGNVHDQGAAENMLSGALKSLFALAENYPDLKANDNFKQLQNELVDTEDKIQASRRFYNSTVREFNTKVEQFPAKVVADMFKFKSEEFFEIEEEEQKEVVDVDFNKGETMQAAPAPEAAPEPEQKPEESAPAPEAKEEEAAPAGDTAETSPSEGEEPSQAEASPEATGEESTPEEEKKEGEA